jgi:hypothetical protein
MIALAIVAAVVAALLLLRVGAQAEFSDGGLRVTARVGFVKIAVLPKKERGKKLDATQKAPKKREKSPGSAYDFRKLISGAVKLLNALRRKILIKRLTVIYVQGGGDAFTLAMTHGGVAAVFGMTQAALETAFRVKSYSLQTSVDYLAAEPRIYAEAAFSLAVWQVISLGISAIIVFIKAKKPAAKEETAITAAKGEA